MTTWSKGHVTLWVGSSERKLPFCQVWWPQILWKFRYKFFSFVTWPHNREVTWIWSWGFSTASYHSAKFGGHRYCKNAEESFFHLSHYHVIKSSRDFEAWFSTTRKCRYKVLNLSRDHVIKSLRDLVDAALNLKLPTTLSILVVLGLMVRKM